MYLYNISNSDSVYKKKLFTKLFQNAEINKIFYDLILMNSADLKMQKFTLGILHNLIFNQSLNLNEMQNIQEFIGFLCLFINKVLGSYDSLHKSNKINSAEKTQEEKDLNEINDWIHLIFNLIMKTDHKIKLNLEFGEKSEYENENNNKTEIIKLNNKENNDNYEINFFDLLTNNNIVADFYFVILEIMRDCVENSKSVSNEKYFIISKSNFKRMLNLLLQNIIGLSLVIKDLIETKNFEKIDFYTFDKLSFSNNKFNFIEKENSEKEEEEIKIIINKNKKEENKKSLFETIKLFTYCEELELRKILAFKEFICLADIFSVFLVTEEYKEFLFELKTDFDFVENLYALIKCTDFIYDDYFLRFKSLKNSEKLNYDYTKLNENNVFFSFQTNVMKFLSNYAYKNEAFKEKLIGDPEKFLAFLNHMKIDNCNPFKKEWTILMVKSLCESEKILYF